MSNILVTGANGQLGSTFQRIANDYKEHSFFFCGSKTLNITNTAAVKNFVDQNNIGQIINCAAYTAVDKAEDEAEKAKAINHLAVKNLALLAKEAQIQLIHISTDYVFDGLGNMPYKETDAIAPLGVYGKTKADGETAMLQINPPKSCIVRTAWVFSEFGSNFVKTMLKLGTEKKSLSIVNDQIGCPTYTINLAKTILKLLPQLNQPKTEVLHFCSEGVCSWYDFTKAIFEIKKYTCEVKAIPSAAFPTKAKRPFYSVLSKEKIKKYYRIEVPHWRDALKDCLEKL